MRMALLGHSASQAPQTVQPMHPLAPGIRQIAYTVGSASIAPTATASVAPVRAAPAALAVAKPVAAAPAATKVPATAGIDTDLVNAVEAGAGGAPDPARKVPMQ